MSGDPHVWYHGRKTSIHLPATRFTKLLQQGDVAIFAKGGPSEDDKMNFVEAVTVFSGDHEAVQVTQKHGRLFANETLIWLTVDGAASKRGRHLAAHGVFEVNATEREVKLQHLLTGLQFVVASRATARRDSPDSHHLNIRFVDGLVTEGKGAAVGTLPQLWGTEPLSPETAKLIRK